MYPKTYALVENGVVINLIWLDPMNASDFPNAVSCDGIFPSIGDLYVDGAFVFLNAGGGGVESPVTPEIQSEGEQPA